MPHNPLAQPLFWPVAWRLALTLLAAWAIAGLLVAALARRYALFLPLGLFLLTCLTRS